MAFPSNTQFQPIILDGQPIFDVVGDESPISTDIVGNSTFPAAYIAYDGTTIYFRIRVNGDPRNSQNTGFANFAWGFLVNTSGTPGIYNWLTNVNGLDNSINLVQNTQQIFNSWNDPAEGTNGRGAPNVRIPIVNFDVARVTLTNDGSNFGGNPDYFIDYQFSAAQFFQTLGITANSSLQFVIFSSANANNYNKDSLRTSEGFQFIDTLTDPVTPNEVDIRAKLAASKVITFGPASVVTGSIATWNQTVTVTNTGRALARSVTVADVFNIDQLSSVTNIAASAGSAVFNSSNRTLSWNIGNLAAGQSVTLTYSVTGTFTSAGTRRLNTVTASGIDDQTGAQLTNAVAFNDITVTAAASITGQVTSGQTGLPLTNVTVQLRNSNNVLVGTATTNAQGNYSFTQLSPGTYSLTFIQAGFTTLTQSATVAAGQTQVVNVILQPVPGTLTGTVTAQGGAPIAGATVRLTDQFNAVIATVTTNASGQYTVTGITPGQYTLSASAPNFQSQTRGTSIVSGQTTTENFTLAPSPGTVTGTVTVNGGTPVQGALVEVLDAANNVIAQTVTNASGQYTVSQLSPGTYQLRVTAANFQTGLLGFTVAAGQTSTQNVVLQPSPGTLSGTVTDAANGAVLSGTSVTVVNQSGATVASVLTNAQGQYTVSNLAPGTYSVTFGNSGYASQTIGAVIQPNATTTLNASLSRIVGAISGTVTDNQGGAISNATVNVFLNNSLIASVNTNGNGTYTIPNLAPGNYTVSASGQNFQTGVQGVQVIGFQTSLVNFSLSPNPGSLTGAVTANGGTPVPGAVINVKTSASGAVVATTVTDQNGIYLVSNLAPGTYFVSAAAQDFQIQTQGAAIQSNQTTALNFTLSPNPVTIMGTVTNQQTGQPISGAQIEVRILDANGAVVATLFTDLQGMFQVQQLAPGTYTVVAGASGFQTDISSVSIPPGGQANLTIALAPNPGFITGTVSSGGNPVAGASVSVVDQNNVQISAVITDSQGNYTASGLPPGNYNVVVNAQGFQSSIAGAVVTADATAVVNVSLTPNPGSITGTITPVIQNTIVQLYTGQGVFIQSTLADNSGSYQFLNLAPGNYIVTASAPDYTTESAGAVVVSNAATSVNITINPNPASISGTVLDPIGTPVSNAVVRVVDANETLLGLAGTDANGSYTIGNLPPGSFTVIASAPDFGSALTGVTLQPGGNVPNVNFTLTPNPGSLSGLVSNGANGAPLPGATVVVRQATGSGVIAATVTSGPDGNFLVQGLAPGSYTVTASLSGFGTGTTGATVVSSTVTTANLSLVQLRGSISGQLRDPDGNPITGENLQVRLLDLNGVLIQTLVAQPDGTFVFLDILPGSYILNASAAGFQAASIGVQVAADQETQAIVTLLSSPAVLTGQVLNQQTLAGIAGALVSVTNPNTGILIGSGTTNQDGTFTIGNLPAGSFLASADAQNFGTASVAVILTAGQTANTLLSLTPNPGSAAGSVVNRENGDAIPGASVQIFDQTGAFVVSVVTNAQGQFTAASLAPGNYTAIAAVQGFTSQTISFIVFSDTQSTASFALEPNPSQIRGTVTNAGTGDPVAGASVIIRQFTSTGPIITSTATDSFGFYSAPNLPQGTFTVIVLDPAFSSQASSVTLEPGEIETVNFALQQLPSTVQGTITDADTGQPLINTLVSLFDDTGILVTQTQTDINGFYQINGFAAGNYTNTFTNPDFQSQSFSFTAQPNQTSVINAALIADPGGITGQVFDGQTFTPLAGASVLVYPAIGINPIASLVTDGTGRYTLNSLPPGSYILVGSYTNYASSSTGITVRSNTISSSDIVLAPNPASVSGTVSSEFGQPIINATVRILDQNETVLGTAVTNEFGQYAITDLPQGNQQIIVSAPGFATQLGGVILTPGQMTENVDFVLTANTGSIAGLITASDTGQPITGAIAVVRTIAGVPVVVASTSTDENGNYFVPDLQPGSYTVTGSASGFGISVVGAIVVSDQTTQADISLPRLVGSISGTVTDIQGNALLNVPIQIRVFDQSGILLQTLAAQSDGTFLITNLPPGSYQLTILAENYAAMMVGASVTANETTTLSVSLTPNPGTATGQVLSAQTGTPIPGAIVSVTDTNGLPIGSTVTDSGGDFIIPNLPTGSLVISAVAPDFGSDSRSIILTPGGTAASILSLTPNPGIISGFVTNGQSGDPLSGAVLQVFDSTLAIVGTLTTDAAGFYQFANLSPGQYRIIASAFNFGTDVQDVTVLSNQTTSADFALAPNPGSIFGTVVNQQTGAFITGAAIVIRQFSPSGPIVQSTATDSSGQFTVLNLQPGTYAITASNTNFGTQTATVLVQSNAVTNAALALPPNPGAVTGTVTSAQTGDPLADTQVRVLNDNGILAAVVQTDLNGVYLVQGLTPGTYTIVLINADFQSRTIGAIIGAGETATVNAALAPNPGTITGIISDAVSGNPLQGAIVQLFPSQSLIPIENAATDQNGRYSFAGIEPGEYIVAASAENYARGTAGATVFPNAQATVNLGLTPNPAAVVGTITQNGGTPVGGATVRILDQNETVLGTGITDQNGNYTIGNLPQGTKTAVISASGFGTLLTGVTLSPGQTTTLNAQLTPNAGSIRGTVTDQQTGLPIAGADLVVRRTGAAPIVVANATSGTDGSYLVAGLAPGTYTITAVRNGYGAATTGATVVSDATANAPIVLTPLSGTIAGTITDPQGNPITGNNLQIQVFNQNGQLVKTVLAGSDGTFIVNGLAPGSYQVVVTAPNYATGTFSSTVVSEQTTALTPVLQPNPASVNVTVTSTESGDPISGAIVTITLPNGTVVGIGVTDANGFASIGSLPPQSLNLSVAAENFSSFSQAVNLSPGQTLNISVSLAAQIGTLSGSVLNAGTSAPIAGATVEVFDFTRGLTATVATDAFGNYQVQNLSAGVYRVIASADNFGSTVQEATVFANQQTVLNFSLPPNPGSIQGIVVSQQTGEPISGAAVVIRQFSPTGPAVDSVFTNQNGEFTVNNLAPGAYTVVASSENFGTQAGSVFVSSNAVSTINLALIPNPGSVQGTLTDSQTGTPIAGALIRIQNSNGAIVQEVQTDSDGVYRIDGLSPGNYSLTGIAQSFQRASVGFNVASNATTTVNLALDPNPGSISGRVTDQQTGRALEGASVQIFPVQGLFPIANALTDQNGNYTVIGLAPGEYTAAADISNYARGAVGAIVTADQSTIANLELMPNPAAISGTVTSTGGQPVPNASVRVLDQNETVLGSAQTDQNGNYVISGLPSGSQTVIVTSETFAGQISGVTLVPGDFIENVNFVLTPNPGAIEGFVSNAQTGDPIAGAISIIRLTGGSGVVVANDVTDSDGFYSVAGLAPGTYTVTASKTGFGTASVGAVVFSNTVTSANLQLSPNTGAISGIITDLQGSPILGMGVQIGVYDQSGSLVKTLLAQSDGSYTVLDLLPGSYTLVITAPNFAAAAIGAIVVSDQTTQANVALIPNQAAITGQVLNTGTGDAINGALITVTDSNGLVLASAVSGIDGSFTIQNLPPATLLISAVAQGFGADSKAVLLSPGQIGTTTLSLTPNPGTLTGSVVNGLNNQPIPGAVLQVFDFTGALAATVLSNDNGFYQVQNLAPGTYRVIASAANFGSAAQDAAIASNAVTTLLFQLQPNPGSITGTVYNGQTGAPIQNASVVIRQFSAAGPAVATTATNAQGEFAVFNLAPGSYTVIASQQSFGTQAASASVESNEIAVVQLNLPPNPGSVQGTITNAQTATPLTDTLIRIIDSGGVLVAVSQTDLNGVYRVDSLAPGSYSLVAVNADFQNQTLGFTAVSDQTVTLNAALNPNPGSITGTAVSTQTAAPIAGASIQIYPSGSFIPVFETVTDQNGSFTAGSLQPGQYTVTAAASNFGTVSVGALVSAGAATAVVLSLSPLPAAVSGQITDQSGNPLPNAVIRILDQNQNVVGTGATDLNGNYSVGNLAPGTYTVSASAPNYGTGLQGVSVAAGQTLTGVNLALTANPGSISGTVTNSATADPLARAIVTIRTLQGDSNIVVQTVNTDEAGNYLAQGLAPGSYSVTASASGFASQTQTALVSSNQTATANFALIAETGNISGTIRDGNGDPITGSNIFVRVFDGNGLLVKSITAEPDGTYSIIDLAPGNYTVVAQAPGFAASSAAAAVVANQTTSLDLQLAPLPASITGQVVSQGANTPLQGAAVTASVAGQVIASAVTDASGNFQLTNLPAGTITLTVSQTGFADNVQAVILDPGETEQVTVSLSPLLGSISGTVINQLTSDPIAGALITIRQFSPAGPVIATAVTDAGGTFLTANLEPGSYTVIAQSAGFGTQSASVAVLANEVSNVTIGLTQAPGTVQGTVRRSDTNDPVAGAAVQVIRRDGTLVDEVTSDGAGFYAVEGLPADSYTLVVSSPAFQNQSVGFTILPGQATTVNVFLAANPGVLTGTVTDLFSGGPIAGAVVLVFPSQGIIPIAQETTDQNGQFSVPGLAPGEYNVVASASNYARRGTGAVIFAGQTTDVAIQLSPNPATISGTVTDTGGTPVTNATVRILDQNETVLGTAITDEFGNYSVSNLPQGTLTVLASAPDFAANLTAVTVTPGQILTDVNIALSSLFGTISGQITNAATGDPIVGAIAVVRTVGGTSVIIAADTTDVNGNYLLEGLSPGSYSVVGTAAGFGSITVGAIVQANAVTTANIALPPDTGMISGSLTDTAGMAVTGSNIAVQVFDINGILVKTLLADSDGTFTIMDLAPGTYLVQITAPNYATAVASAVVAVNETAVLPVILSPNPATVTGQVINAVTFDPLSGVIVTVTDLNGLIVGSAVSDQNGQFTIQNLPPNTLNVSASSTQPGFGSASVSVQLGPGAVNNVTLSLPPVAGSLTGTVRDAETQNPLQGASVQVFDSTRALVATVVTDQNGQYLVNNLIPGNVRVTASAANFGTVVQETAITANAQTVLDFNLPADPGTIQGTVINQVTGLPLSGVSIVVRQFSPTGPVVASSATDANGFFTIPNLAPGSYTVLGTLPGFGTQAGSTVVEPGQTSSVQLSLPPNPGSVQGFVTEAGSGFPLVNTLIRLVDVNGVLTAVGQTDSIGRYSIQNLPPGSYTVTAINTNYQQQTIGTTIVSGQTATLDIELQPDPGSITGTVTNAAAGSPLSGAFVQLFPSQGLQPLASAVTDSLGRYSFAGIKPGTYSVTADAVNFARAIVGVTVASNTESTANLALSPNPAAVSGTVRDLAGNPIGNATVRLLNGNETVIGTGITGGDGTYTISGLPPGTFNIIVSAGGFSSSTAAITLTPGEFQSGIDFSLAANPGSLTGIVTDEATAAGLAGASIIIRNSSGVIIASAFTNTDGRYTIQNLAPGTYSAVFTAEGYGSAVIGAQIISDTAVQLNASLAALTGSISGSVVDQLGNQVTGQDILVKIFNENLVLVEALTAQADGTFSVFNLIPGTYLVNASAPGFGSNTVSSIVFANGVTSTSVTLTNLPATVTGVISDSGTGLGISGASITISRSNGVILATGFSGDQGVFTFPNLPAGTFLLTAQAPGYGNATTSIILTAGETTTASLALSQLTGRLLGQVTSAQDLAPIAGAVIQLFDENRTLILTVVSDARGNFTVPALSPGQYTAVINAQDFGSEFRGFTITAGTDTVLAIDLTPNPGIIQGFATNAAGGAAIPSVSVIVRALSPAGPIIATTLTDSNGFYQVTGLAPGAYSVIFSGAPSFGSEIASVVIDPGETEFVSAVLSPQPGTVQGRVTDEAGLGISDALVQLFSLQGGLIRRVQTDTDGNYSITGFTAGSYTLSVLQQNFQSSSAGFDVLPGQTASVNFILQASPGSITGIVRDAVTTQPVPGAIVQLFQSQSLTPIAFTVTDQQGSYTFSGIQPGSYLVTASEFNYASSSIGATVAANQQVQANILLQPNPASISGQVTDAFGSPINNASVRILDQNETLVGFALTGADGTYAIGNIPAGSFKLVVSAEGYQTALSGISLSAGEQRTNVDFSLSANPGRISGTVTDASGNPITGAVVTVRIIGAGGVVVATVVTDSDGNYTAGSLPPGSYTVTVTAQGFETRTVGAIVQSDTTTTTNVSLTGIFGSITGVVLNNLALPITTASVAVSLFDENGILLFTTNAQSNGSFTFPQVAPGNYVITASASGFVTGIIGAVVIPDEAANVTLLLQTGPASIAGFVTNTATGDPIQGAIVTATTVDGQVLAISTSAADGSFTISNLQPGTVILTATATNFGTDSKSVILVANTTAQTTLSLSANPGFLTGVVSDRSSLPIPGAAVQIFDITNGLVASVLTDNTGFYRIDGLTPGTYRAVFTAAGFERLAAGAVIAAGQTTQLNVQLNGAFGTVNGTVLNAQSRSPIQGAAVTIRYQSPSGPIFATVLTDSNGFFEIPGVTEGQISIVATASGYGTQTLTATVFTGQTVTVGFRLLQQTASIQGTVTNQGTGAPLPDTRIRVIDSSGATIATTQTDDSGAYLVPNLSPGTYGVVALNVNFQAQSQSAVLNPGDAAIVNFALFANPSALTGTVTNELTALPIIGALVEVFDSNGLSIAFGLTDENGQYVIQGLPQGTFTATASAPGYVSESASVLLTAGETAVQDFQLGLAQTRSGVIAGRITDFDTGAPIAGTRVDITNSQGELVTFVFTDANGQYFFEGLSPDVYTVFAAAEGYQQAQRILTLGENESILDADFALIRRTAFGTISGQVRNALTQAPVVGALIEVRNEQGEVVATGFTDANGNFIIPDLLPGTYSLVTIAAGFVTDTTVITVTAGEISTASIRLQPSPFSHF